MKKLILTSAFAAATLFCSCTDEKPKDPDSTAVTKTAEAPKPEVVEIAATDSSPALWSIDGVKWLKEEREEFFTWSQANFSACPDNYRLPTAEEFKQLSAILPELSQKLSGLSQTLTLEDMSTRDTVINQGEEGYWWTTNISPMGSDSARPQVVAAKLTRNSQAIQFVDMPFDISMKVRCIQDSSNTPVFVNPTPVTTDGVKGYISEVSLEPYYENSFENMGCADCCCEEGNGGRLTVSVNTENGERKDFEVMELSGEFCGTVAKEVKGVATPIVDRKNNCKLAKMENFSFLQLFQPGVKVKQTTCQSRIFIKSEVGDGYETASCGDSIALSFAATVKEIALIQSENPDDEKVCSYTLKMLDSGKDVHTIAPCSNANANTDYNVEATIILEPIAGNNINPILESPYPCCYGEVRSFQLINISFTEYEGKTEKKAIAVAAR